MKTNSLLFKSKKLNKVIDVADQLVDSTAGIINEVREIGRFAGDPEFYHYSCTAGNTESFTLEKNFKNTGGASLEKDLAKVKAIGEAIERYSSAIFELESLELTTFNEASFDAGDPADFALYSEEQYNEEGFMFVPFTKDTPVRWCETLELISGTKKYIPAASIFMPYMYYQGTGDAPIMQPISTGMASHTSILDAIISGICEVVERDAVTIMWQAMTSPPQVRIETLDDTNYEIVSRLEKNGSKVFMFDITTDNQIPTVLSVLKGNGNPSSPAYIFAGASDPNPHKAARKSLEELPHTRRYSARLMQYSKKFETQFPNHLNVTGQAEHLHFYCDHDNAKYADFLFKSSERIMFDDIAAIEGNSKKEVLDRILEKIDQTDCKVYLKEMTTSDVAALGFHVVRIVIPGMNRLCMGFQNRCLGGKRIWTVPQKLGYKGIDRESGDNPAPHPYP